MRSVPAWLSRTRVPLVDESTRLISTLLDGRMSPARDYDADVLDLSSNENPLGPGPLAQSAVARAVKLLHRYPLVSSPTLRRRLSVHLGVAENEIVVGTGATGLLGVIAQLVLSPGDRAAFSRSSLFAYRLSVIAASSKPVEIPLTADFHHDLDALAAAACSGARLILISNPHNPTGTVFNHAQFEAFLSLVPPEVLVVIDEAYLEFVDDYELPRSIALARARPNLIVLRTFSKVYGLANARVGYAVGQPDGIEAIEALAIAKNPGGIGTLSEVAAAAALGDRDHVERSIRHVADERARAYRYLDELGMAYIPSHANFIMACAGPDMPELVAFLRERRILVTSGEFFGYPQWFRFSLQMREDTDRFVNLLREFRSGRPVESIA